MRRKISLTFCVFLLVFYGLVSVAGPGLHDLPGCGHSEQASGSEPQQPEGGPEHASDDCSVCQFHSQGQQLTESVPVPVDLADLRRAAVASREIVWPVRCRPGSPRAPPSSRCV